MQRSVNMDENFDCEIIMLKDGNGLEKYEPKNEGIFGTKACLNRKDKGRS